VTSRRDNPTRMHIMHVIDTLAVGGAERMLVELANRAAEDGHRVSVCITRDGRTLASELRPEVSLLVLGRRRRFDLQAVRRLADAIERDGVSVVHAHGRYSFALMLTVRIVARMRAPVILHDHMAADGASSVPLSFRLVSRRAVDAYVGVYEGARAWAARAGIPPGRVQVIDNSLSLARFNVPGLDLRRAFSIPPDSLVGIVVAGLRREKGIDTLVEALALSRAGERLVVLSVGGDRDPEYAAACRASAAALGSGREVRFIGERADVPALIRGADFALLPSRVESGPLSLIEYLASGMPVVATRVGGISLRAAELGVPCFVPPDNPAAFAEALDQLIRLTPEERRLRGQLGQRVAFEHFDIGRVMEQWYELYAKLAEARQA
jgi:glycosyltransferase involved in cell wall biosynthesis